MRHGDFLFGTPDFDVRFRAETETLIISARVSRPGQKAMRGLSITGPDAVQVAAALIVAWMRQHANETLHNLLDPPVHSAAWNAAAGGWYRPDPHSKFIVQRPEMTL